jgi:hypothetical protein
MRAKSLKELIPNTKLTSGEIAFAAQFNLTGDHLQESHKRITADGRFESIPVRRVIWARHPTISMIE